MTDPAIALPLLTATGAYAAWSDCKHRRLPNSLTALVALLGLAAAAFSAGLGGAKSDLIHSSVALALGFALFVAGGIGGGDVKYYAAVAAWFPAGMWARLLGMTALSGLLLVCVWYGLRLRGSMQTKGDHAKLPFGVAIAAGGVMAAWPVS